jgi:chromosome segregation ATPase
VVSERSGSLDDDSSGTGDDGEGEDADLKHLMDAAEEVLASDPSKGLEIMHGVVHRHMQRLLNSPPAIVVRVIQDLLQGRPAPGSSSSAVDLETRLRSYPTLTSELAILLAHLEEEYGNFQRMLSKLKQTREIREGAERTVEKQHGAHLKLLEEAKELRAAERAAKEELANARAAAKAAKKEVTVGRQAIELDLAQVKESDKRLRKKLETDRERVAVLAAEAAALAGRVDAAEKEAAGMLARGLAAAEIIRANFVADRELVDAQRRRSAAADHLERELELAEELEVRTGLAAIQRAEAESTLSAAEAGLSAAEAATAAVLEKNEATTRRLEGLRYQLMDAMQDVARVREDLGAAEMAAMCSAVPLWNMFSGGRQTTNGARCADV